MDFSPYGRETLVQVNEVAIHHYEDAHCGTIIVMLTRLPAPVWRLRIQAHEDRLRPHAVERTERMSARHKHPVNDFLFEYYSFRPSQLLRWSPGADVLLEQAQPGNLNWKEFQQHDEGLILNADSFPDHRVSFLRWAAQYLEAIAERTPSFSCFGHHEWAMVYRAGEVRHSSTPLRLAPEEIAKLVESDGVRCTHFDAFRFFTPAALPLNRFQLTRRNIEEHDQKGCIHVTMDLYRYAYKIAPWGSSELLADAFLLAKEARQIDMRASPYDLTEFNIAPILIETREGREEYVECQRQLSRRAEPIRESLIAEYRRLVEAKS